MREFTIRIRFLSVSLGNVKDATGTFRMPRTADGELVFQPQWWAAGVRYAAQASNRHHKLVEQIRWDPLIDGVVSPTLYRRYLSTANKRRYALHEAFDPDQEIGVNCLVPDGIPVSDLDSLLRLAGHYQGISPFGPRKFGLYGVVSIRAISGETDPLKAERPAS